MKSKAEILEEFSLFSVPGGGIGSWLTEQTHSDIFDRLGRIDEESLPAVQLNQLLVMGHEAPVGDGFFRYYWLQAPEEHPYSVRDVPGFSEEWLQSKGMITSLAHLKWGFVRRAVVNSWRKPTDSDWKSTFDCAAWPLLAAQRASNQ